MEEALDDLGLNIRAVERMTGIPAPTLRSWERRYSFPKPQRSANARRLYTTEEVEAIRWVKSRIDEGLSVTQAVRWWREGRVPDNRPAVPALTGDPSLLVTQFLDAARRYDEQAAEGVLSAAFSMHPAPAVLQEVIVPVLHEVGDRWARGELAVSVEHFASNLLRRRLLALFNPQPLSEHGAAVILACVPEEEHELGMLMLAVFLRWSGVRVIYLGANVPSADIVRSARDTDAAAICLAAVNSESLPTLMSVLDEIDAAKLKAPVFAGGDAALGLDRLVGVHVLRGGFQESAAMIAAAVGAR